MKSLRPGFYNTLNPTIYLQMSFHWLLEPTISFDIATIFLPDRAISKCTLSPCGPCKYHKISLWPRRKAKVIASLCEYPLLPWSKECYESQCFIPCLGAFTTYVDQFFDFLDPFLPIGRPFIY